jgi:hypothetical protein
MLQVRIPKQEYINKKTSPMGETLNMKGNVILLPYQTHEILNIVHMCIKTFFLNLNSSTNLHVSTLEDGQYQRPKHACIIHQTFFIYNNKGALTVVEVISVELLVSQTTFSEIFISALEKMLG